jgi:hypothetical protein
MHLYVLTRGVLNATKDWENALSHQYLPFEVLEKGKKVPTKYLSQLAVRPVNLYEIVFPEESLQDVLGMVKPVSHETVSGKWAWLVNFLSKKLGLTKIPDYKPKQLPLGDNVTVIGLGLKKDKVNWTVKDRGNGVFDIGVPKENL